MPVAKTDADPAYDYYSEFYDRLVEKKERAHKKLIASFKDWLPGSEKIARARYNALDDCMTLATTVLDDMRKADAAKEALAEQIRSTVREELDARSATAQPATSD